MWKSQLNCNHFYIPSFVSLENSVKLMKRVYPSIFSFAELFKENFIKNGKKNFMNKTSDTKNGKAYMPISKFKLNLCVF